MLNLELTESSKDRVLESSFGSFVLGRPFWISTSPEAGVGSIPVNP
jgi:hypothetical protein